MWEFCRNGDGAEKIRALGECSICFPFLLFGFLCRLFFGPTFVSFCGAVFVGLPQSIAQASGIGQTTRPGAGPFSGDIFVKFVWRGAWYLIVDVARKVVPHVVQTRCPKTRRYLHGWVTGQAPSTRQLALLLPIVAKTTSPCFYSCWHEHQKTKPLRKRHATQ